MTKNITTLPTRYGQLESVPEYFRKLAIDAEKFPERYTHAMLIYGGTDMNDAQRFHLTDTPLVYLLGLVSFTQISLLDEFYNDD